VFRLVHDCGQVLPCFSDRILLLHARSI
jgi:hypothetical protein